MHSQANHRSASPGFAARSAVLGRAGAASAAAWCAGPSRRTRPQRRRDNRHPLRRAQCRANSRPWSAPRSTSCRAPAKRSRRAELVQATPGKRPGTLQSIAFKPAEGGSEAQPASQKPGPPRHRQPGLRGDARPPAEECVSAGRSAKPRSLVNAKLKLIHEQGAIRCGRH